MAEDAAAGRFTCAGETVELGPEPDWLTSELPADEEWRIDWVKFYYGLDLAHAYRTTGEERFRAAWERLVASYLRQVPPATDPSEVTARRIVNWIYAWQQFGALSNGLEPALTEGIAAEARHVRETLTPERNHRTLELYALAIAAIAFEDAGLLRLAVAELDRNLARDFLPDGVHYECSTHYHMIALRSFAGLQENTRRHGFPLPDAELRGVRRRAAGGRPRARHLCRQRPPHWFKGTAAHNTVCVDGLDQTPYARKAPKGPTAQPRLLAATEDELAGEARSPAYEAVHRRGIRFVDGRHRVIEDTLSGDREHRYDLRFHLMPGEAWTSGSAVLTSDLAMVIDGADEITVEPGWVSPGYGVTKLAAEQLCRLYHAEQGVDAVALRFFSVYGPRQRPDVAFRRFCEAAAAGAPIEV